MAVSRLDIDSAVDRLMFHEGHGHMIGLPTRAGTSSTVTTGVPTNGIAGFAPGALFINFKGAPGSALYVNIGSNTSAQWVNIDLDTANSIVSLVTTTTISAKVNGGRTNLLSLAGGFTSTLPAATGSGVIYPFMVGIVSTTGYLIAAAGSDVFKGTLQIAATGATYDTPGTAESFLSTTNQTITLNGTTKGGKNIGDWVQVQDILSGVWSVTGLLTGSGTLATPFS